MIRIGSCYATSAPARIVLVACLALLFSACSYLRDQADPSTVSIRGIPATLEQLNISTTADAQDQMVNELIRTAGLNFQPPTLSEDWYLVTKAGVYEIGRQCDQYLDALFRFNREQRAGHQDLAAAAAATGAIMGISGAGAKALAITAAAFGLATSLFDASVNSVLFTIEPSALRNVALQGRTKYLDDLRDRNVTINSRPDMLIALQGYLTQCSPAAIEANINNAASGAPSVVTPSQDGSAARAAAALAAPGTALIMPRKPRDLVQPRITEVPKVSANYARFLEDASVPYSPSQLNKAFAALCVLPAEVNEAAAGNTTARIKAFQQWWHFDPTKPMPSATGRLTSREIDDFLLGQPDCQRSRFENIYEVNFRRGAGSGPPKDINSPVLIGAMNQKLAEPKLAPNASVKDMRSRIPDVRNALAGQLVLTDIALSNQLTKDLVNLLLGGK